MAGTLEIVPYDPSWPAAFAAERDRIAAVLGDLAVRIEHHGSTSVPGLGAKPREAKAGTGWRSSS